MENCQASHCLYFVNHLSELDSVCVSDWPVPPRLWPGRISRKVAASELSRCHTCSGLNRCFQYIMEQRHCNVHVNVPVCGIRRFPGLGSSLSGLERCIVRFAVDNMI